MLTRMSFLLSSQHVCSSLLQPVLHVKHSGGVCGVCDVWVQDVSVQTNKTAHVSLCAIKAVSSLLHTTKLPAATSAYKPNSQQFSFMEPTDMCKRQAAPWWADRRRHSICSEASFCLSLVFISLPINKLIHYFIILWKSRTSLFILMSHPKKQINKSSQTRL